MGTERKGQEHVATQERQKAAVPKRWKVLLFNDDYTTMEFVVDILEGIFRKSPAEAVQSSRCEPGRRSATNAARRAVTCWCARLS